MSTYQLAPKEVLRVVERMMKKFHPELHDAGVSVDCIFAHASTDKNGDAVGPALKHQGYPAGAVVKIIELKDRAAGRGDSEIVIDGDQWELWSELERDALIDHELTHLELVTDKDGVLIRDDLERPRLKSRKHDHQFGWFDCVARRHGESSFEVRQWNEFESKRKQLWLFDASDESELNDKIEKVLVESGVKFQRNVVVKTSR